MPHFLCAMTSTAVLLNSVRRSLYLCFLILFLTHVVVNWVVHEETCSLPKENDVNHEALMNDDHTVCLFICHERMVWLLRITSKKHTFIVVDSKPLEDVPAEVLQNKLQLIELR